MIGTPSTGSNHDQAEGTLRAAVILDRTMWRLRAVRDSAAATRDILAQAAGEMDHVRGLAAEVVELLTSDDPGTVLAALRAKLAGLDDEEEE